MNWGVAAATMCPSPPGLNFVCGLTGETGKTYQLNEQFLVRVRDAGLAVRRVNIRQVMPFEGTPAFMDNTLGKYERRFRVFKEFVRTKIDLPMLQRVFPIGTVLREVRNRGVREPLVRAPDGVVPHPRRHPPQS